MGPWNCQLREGSTWDDIPTAFVKMVKKYWVPIFSYETGLETHNKVAYHKADVVFVDGERRISKQCWSYRPEGQFWIGDKKVAHAYFGMGTNASHDKTHNFVVFGTKLSVLVAILNVVRSANLKVDM